MILAYLICGIAFGMISAVVTAVMGYGLLLALLAYSLGGIVGICVLVAGLLVTERQRGTSLVATEH